MRRRMLDIRPLKPPPPRTTVLRTAVQTLHLEGSPPSPRASRTAKAEIHRKPWHAGVLKDHLCDRL
eukprot:171571-Prymnesium_polylepis.1